MSANDDFDASAAAYSPRLRDVVPFVIGLVVVIVGATMTAAWVLAVGVAVAVIAVLVPLRSFVRRNRR